MTRTQTTRVLLVSTDERFLERSVRKLVRAERHLAVETVSEIDVAVSRLSTCPADCVIATNDPPDATGLDRFERLRDTHGDRPYVLCTDEDPGLVADRAASAGITATVTKPTTSDEFEDLARLVAGTIDRYRRRLPETDELHRVDLSGEGFAIVDRDGEYVHVNRAYAERFDRDPDALLGTRWTAVFPGLDRSALKAEIEAALEQSGYWSGVPTAATEPPQARLSLAPLDGGRHVCVLSSGDEL